MGITEKYPGPLLILPWIEREKRKAAADPNYKRNLVTLTGEEWKEIRRILDQRLLQARQVATYAPRYSFFTQRAKHQFLGGEDGWRVKEAKGESSPLALTSCRMNSIADDVIAIMEARLANTGKISDLERLMYMYATEGIGSVIFDQRIHVLGKCTGRVCFLHFLHFFHCCLHFFTLSYQKAASSRFTPMTHKNGQFTEGEGLKQDKLLKSYFYFRRKNITRRREFFEGLGRIVFGDVGVTTCATQIPPLQFVFLEEVWQINRWARSPC